VFAIATVLEFILFYMLKGGLPRVSSVWRWATSPEMLETTVLNTLFFSLFVGSIVVSTIPKNNPKNLLLRTMLIAVMASWGADLLLAVFGEAGDTIIISLFADILGGFIGGMVVPRLVKIYDETLASKEL
jgi:hypothetical protein